MYWETILLPDGTQAGSYHFAVSDHALHVHQVFVEPRYRGLGLVAPLLRRLRREWPRPEVRAIATSRRSLSAIVWAYGDPTEVADEAGRPLTLEAAHSRLPRDAEDCECREPNARLLWRAP